MTQSSVHDYCSSVALHPHLHAARSNITFDGIQAKEQGLDVAVDQLAAKLARDVDALAGQAAQTRT